jgi:hypothetical protein
MEAPNPVGVGALVATHLEDRNSAQAARNAPNPVGAGVG